MAAAAPASWQQKLATIILERVRGPLTNWGLKVETLIDLSLDVKTPDQVARDVMMAMIDWVRHNGSDHFNEEARAELQRAFPGEYFFLPLKEGEVGKSLTECFKAALINGASEQVSTLLMLKEQQKSIFFETIPSHIQMCNEEIAANGPQKEMWVKSLATTEGYLKKMEAQSYSLAEDDEEDAVVIDFVDHSKQNIEREIRQLKVWQKHPEQLLALARPALSLEGSGKQVMPQIPQ